MSEEWEPIGPEDRAGLRGRAARGLTWTVVEIWGRQLLNFLIFVILARLLAPEELGLVALALVFVAFAQLIVDQGLGDALIQRRTLNRSHIDSAFWAAIATGALFTIAMLVLAGPVADVLNEPDLAPVLRVLSATFVLAAFSTIQMDLLRRDLSFGPLAARTLAATFGGGLVGIAMAILGYGAWSLVGQQLASASLSVLMLWRVSPWRPRFHFSMSEFRELFSFGLRVVGSDATNYVGRNADNLLIGAFLGTSPLGLYAVGFRILEVTQTVLVNVARRITFPVFAKLQDDPDRIASAYFKVSRVASAVILPGYVGLAIVATPLTVVLFGERWAQSGPVATILFTIGPALSVQAFSNSILNAVGQPGIVLRLRLVSTVLSVIGFAIAVPFGITAVAAAFVIRGYLLAPLVLYWTRRYAGIAIGPYLAQMRPAAIATAVMAVLMLVVGAVLGAALPLVSILAVQVLVGVVAFATTLLVMAPTIGAEVAQLVREAIPRRRRPVPE